MPNDKYKCEFAPDGKHWILNAVETLEKAWAFLHSADIQILKYYNPETKVRIVNSRTNEVVGNI